MTGALTAMEFKAPESFATDRRDPVRWIASYAIHYWYIGAVMVLGAVGNAALAAAVPVLVGQAFDAILKQPPGLAQLPRIALLIALSQVFRSVLQFGRNFG
ncbi:MAG: hypothetical protein IT316_01400, partial [Anaerolineales bacterium]|nr:hypothetical protein [Anaerolineales bacterium]